MRQSLAHRDANGDTSAIWVGACYLSSVVPRRFEIEIRHPPGWTKSIGYLKRNLTTLPAYNSNGSCNYNLVRDSADDTFQQISRGKRGWGTAQMIAGMPIWGGTNNNTIRLNPAHDNVVYAADGRDTAYFNGLLNTIYGDGGTDTAVFHGPRWRYTITPVTSDGSEVIVSPPGFPAGRYHKRRGVSAEPVMIWEVPVLADRVNR